MARAAPRPARAALRLLENAGTIARDAALYPFEARAPREWIGVDLERGLSESSAQPRWIEQALRLPASLFELERSLERAGGDPRVRGVLLRPGRGALGWAKLSALTRAVSALRRAGKRVVVHAESTGNAGAWLGAVADHFWMAPEGRLDLLGIRAESPFLRRALDRLGIRAEVLASGRYKSAGEILSRDSMSEPAREALEAVVDVLYDALVSGLASGRAGSAEVARRWIDEGPYLAAEAKEIGLVDELVYADELPLRLAALTDGEAHAQPGAPREARVTGEPSYRRLSRERFRWRPLLREDLEVHVVPVVGPLRHGSPVQRAVQERLRRLAKLDRARAVVLRVDSPGGDPLASDLLWHAVRELAARKPVVASLGDTAASGGYYVAMAASEIVAEPTTLTGSIGVVLAALELDQLLERLGVRVDAVERGRHAGIYDPLRARPQDERALLRRQVERLYRAFLEKAADGRGISRDVLHRAAQGRVWAGVQALEHGLVDALGGLDTAWQRACVLAGFSPQEARPVFAPLVPGSWRRLLPSLPVPTGADFLSRPELWCPIQVPLR